MRARPLDPSPLDPSALGVTVVAARLGYRGRLLFDELNARFQGGVTTGLLGPSGVGKTSLLRLIAGLAPAEDGTRVVGSDGRPLTGRVAYMAQQDLLLPWLTALDNVLLGARLRGENRSGERRARAIALLQRVGLGDHLGARPAQLSGGMRQRVALARTLMEDRPVVLMDEPFAALDAVTRVRAQNTAAAMLAGRTVLLVTHDPLEALRLAHRVHVMTGHPARLDRPIVPPGRPPRPADDERVLRLQGELLRRLAGTAGAE